MEAYEIAIESVNQSIAGLIGEVVPERKGSRSSAITEGISEIRPLGVVPPDGMGDGVGKLRFICEGTGRNLEIVVGVTPSTQPTGRGVAEDGGILEVGACIYGVLSG